MGRAIRSVATSGVSCRVCGCVEVQVDEVREGGALFLAECPRCDHRWTSRTPLPRVRTVALHAPRAAEAATAA